DFDGFIWFKLFFSDPGQTIQLEALRVDFPIRPEVAKYCEHRTTTPYGAIAPNSNINFNWLAGTGNVYRNNYHWVGDEEKGLGFAYRSLQYWQPTSTSNFCTVLARPAAATYRMNILQSSRMADGLVYEFGIQPTPIKALPPDYHSMITDGYWDASQSIMWQLGNRMDLTAIAPYSGHNGAGCNVFPGLHDPENVNDCLATLVTKCHDEGIAVAPMMCPQKLSETIPDLNDYLADWRCVPLQQLDWEGVMNYDNCAGSEDLIDWFVYQWQQRVLEYNLDSLYMDGWFGIWPCKNQVHGCGYVDDSNQLQEIVPILEARTAMMRIATMLEDTIDSPYVPVPGAPEKIEFPNYHFMIHSWQTVTPLMGFGTLWLTGEYLWSDVYNNPNVSYAECLGLDGFRARSMSSNYGVPQSWDAIVWEQQNSDKLSRMVFSWMLPHGTGIWCAFIDKPLALQVFNIMGSFETRRAVFTPAWKTKESLEVVSANDPDILLATWERKTQVLAVVSNIDGNDPNAVISLKWKRSYQPLVTDMLESKAIAFDDVNNTFEVEIGPEDFKLILLQADTDIDDDNDVDFNDLAVFVEEWLTNGVLFDITDNNTVNFEDYAYLAGNWTGPKQEPNEPVHEEQGLIFFATYNNGWDADFAYGTPTATVAHDDPDVYPDIRIDPDGSGKFAGSSPNNLALHHPKGGNANDNIALGEYVAYTGDDGNFYWPVGSYVAWVHPIYPERVFTPAEGFIICQGSHWSYNNSLVLYDQYAYSYYRQFILAGTDSAGIYHCYTDVLPPLGYGETWTFAAATWQLVPDVASSTGYRIDARLMVRRIGDPIFSDSGVRSIINVAPDFTPSTINIASDIWGNRGYGGCVDWVQIYDKALTTSEIQTLFEATHELYPIDGIVHDSNADPNIPLFVATFNNGFDADYAAGDTTATVHHDDPDVYADIAIGSDGSGVFAGSSPNNLALHHDNGMTINDNVQTDEYVTYDASGGNFSFAAGSYVAYVKPVWEESGFVPHQGFIACMNRHWSYGHSMVLFDQYYYNYLRDYLLAGTDALGVLHYYANVLAPGSDSWSFVVATWELIADANSNTGCRMDAKVSVRNAGDPSFTSSGIISTMDVSPSNSPDVFNIASDAWGNRGYGGWVDWVQIYGKALSDAEIESLYNETVETAPIP
ncbi:MAG: hypothetical protein ABIG61_16325, partial [Planctomycetota bacterium]